MRRDIFIQRWNRNIPSSRPFRQKPTERNRCRDLICSNIILAHSPVMKKEDNQWMRSVLQVVRKTALFFQPQIRTKIMNEGWASYWHETLFLQDDRIKGHEVDFARVNAGVTAMPRVGLNPYALGMRLFYHIEEMAEKGRYDYRFRADFRCQRARGVRPQRPVTGREFIFKVRENFSDFMLINSFCRPGFYHPQQAVCRRETIGQGPNGVAVLRQKPQSPRLPPDAVRQPLSSAAYHRRSGQRKRRCPLPIHHFEGKPLVQEFIPNTMLGIEYLWGAPVQLETSEVVSISLPSDGSAGSGSKPVREGELREEEVQWQRVVYTMKDRKLSKKIIG